MTKTTDFQVFVDAQAGVWDDVVRELRNGRKESHWVWFVFPQVTGLGSSEVAERFALRSLSEARAYLAHPLLGPRLAEAVGLLLAAGRPASSILGDLDAKKLNSSLTLFLIAAPDNTLLSRALATLYRGDYCERTMEILAALESKPLPSSGGGCSLPLGESLRGCDQTQP